MSIFNKIALVMATICTTSIIEAQPLKNRILEPGLHVPHLFVLFDTGETEFLAPVISRLESEGKDYRVLVMGTAEGVIKRKGLPESNVIALSSLGVDKVIDKTSSRFETLNESELEVIHSHLKTSNLIVGFASMIQKQLAIEYASDARTFMVWDNFVAPHLKMVMPLKWRIKFNMLWTLFCTHQTM